MAPSTSKAAATLAATLALALATGAAAAASLRGTANAPWLGASDPPSALLAAGKGGLYMSTDGFQSGSGTQVIKDHTVQQVQFIGDGRFAIAVGDAVWHSSDGGASWVQAWVPPKGSKVLVTRTEFATINIGMAVAFDFSNPDAFTAFTLSTKDGGNTWTRNANERNNTGCVGIAVLDESTFVCAALDMNAGDVFTRVTKDMGATWTDNAAVPDTGLTLQNGYDADVFASTDGEPGSDKLALLLVGFSKDNAVNRTHGSGSQLNSGVTLTSLDGGKTWMQSLPPPDERITTNTSFGTTFYEISCDGPAAGTAGGPAGASCTNGHHMYLAAGSYADFDTAGYVVATTDLGKTWHVVYETTDVNVRDVAASVITPGLVCVGGHNVQDALDTATVSCSLDGGKTWGPTHAVPSPRTQDPAWGTVAVAVQ